MHDPAQHSPAAVVIRDSLVASLGPDAEVEDLNEAAIAAAIALAQAEFLNAPALTGPATDKG
jgi:hypothetical protein